MLKCELFAARELGSRRLMMVLHGLGDSPAGYHWLPEALRLPWLNYLLVNAPDPYFTGYSWFDFAGDPAPGIARSRRLLFDLLDEQQRQGFPSEETMAFGFSQGCLMTWEVGLRYPHRLAGVIGISGWAAEPERAVQNLTPLSLQQRFLITHGTMDPLIPFPEVKEQIRLLKAAGLRIQWHELAKEHTIAGEDELGLIRQFVIQCYAKVEA
jgi:phospholipase/carboxylesterase